MATLSLRKFLIVASACLFLTACATQKRSTGKMQGDVYTGSDTVEFLATGVKDRVFFATNKSTLTTASRDTLRKQAAWMRKKKDLTFAKDFGAFKKKLDKVIKRLSKITHFSNKNFTKIWKLSRQLEN